jgi:hypothetical protein
MPIFQRKSPMQKLEAELASLTARATLLNTKRAAAQAALDGAVAARQNHMLGGDLDDTARATKLQNAVDSAGSALAGFDTATTSLADSIVRVEAQLAAGRLAADRHAAAEKLTTQTSDLEAQLGRWLALTRDLAAKASAVGYSHIEAGQIGHYLRNAASEIETAITVPVKNLRASVAAVAAGHHSIPREPVAIEPAKPAAKPELVQLFLLQDATWIDHHGQQRLVGRFYDAELTPAQAARAMRKGWACPVDDPRRKQLRNQAMGRHPDPRSCMNFDLDDDPNTATIDPILALPASTPPQFIPIDRGPPVQLRIATRQVE